MQFKDKAITMSKIIWTNTDEAPALASVSLLPVVRTFLKHAGIEVDVYDISLAGRILAAFPDYLEKSQQVPDHLSALGDLVKQKGSNIIKLPNISASIPQLMDAVKELQQKGYRIPDYAQSPGTDEEKKIQDRFSRVLGSAVNPVLREGNSDRRAAASVKAFARKNPHKMMKPWPESGSRARVAHMGEKDFFDTEKSITLEKPCTARIEFIGRDGTCRVLKEAIVLEQGEVVDTAVMNIRALRSFYAREMDRAQKDQALFSLHLKATMMKKSDPVMFGHCVSVFFQEVLEKHGPALKSLEVNLNNGLSDLLDKIKALAPEKQKEIQDDIQAVMEQRPGLAMVDSDKGITNLHVPNNVIVDASMPNVIRDGGRMWNRQGQLQDTIALIPDRSYALIYQAVIDDCRTMGQFDPALMGSVSNVGLMAKKAEEYGSHDKTFEAPDMGLIRVKDDNDRILLSQDVEKDDIFRMCQTKDLAVRDWVRLGIQRARTAGTPALFWLDPNRAHDRQIIQKVQAFLPDHDTQGLEISILSPVEAMEATLKRVRQGKDTIAVTGNVLRDYLTDLFPILELGTSSRMLSIVPLLKGGGLFETGAGGSAPKHVDQFLNQGHLRWDSLGEYCALVPSLELAAENGAKDKARLIARGLDKAIGMYLEQGKSPSRKTGEMDNRGSTFYLALFWARALAGQQEDKDLETLFSETAQNLEENEEKISRELLAAQGKPIDIGGYFLPDPFKTLNQMRPSQTLNAIIDSL